MKSYRATIQHLIEIAPTLDKPTEFIRWAEEMSDVVCFAYDKDYDTFTEDLTDAVKEDQAYQDDDEED